MMVRLESPGYGIDQYMITRTQTGPSYQIYYSMLSPSFRNNSKAAYVIYIGEEKDKPEEISLTKDLFDGEEASIDVRIKVICEGKGKDIINQYILFSKVYGEQQKKYGRTKEAILETIRICKDRDILREYLRSREKEVVDIMMTLFDEQEIYETHWKNVGKEFEKKGHSNGRAEIVMNAYHNGHTPEQIAVFNGLPLDEVQKIVSEHQ